MKQRRALSSLVDEPETCPNGKLLPEGSKIRKKGLGIPGRERQTTLNDAEVQTTSSSTEQRSVVVEPTSFDVKNGTVLLNSCNIPSRSNIKSLSKKRWRSNSGFCSWSCFGSVFLPRCTNNDASRMVSNSSPKRHRSRRTQCSLWDLSRFATSHILMFLGLWQTFRCVAFWTDKSRSSSLNWLRKTSSTSDGNKYKYNHSFNEQSASQATHMVMVACHSTLVQNNVKDAAYDENLWHTLDYQRGQGLPQSITLHIAAGIETAYNDPHSLLIFSGGETRNDGTGPWSEGSSYFRVADALNLWTPNNSDWSSMSETRQEGGNSKNYNNNNQIANGKFLRSVDAKETDDKLNLVDESVRSRTVTEEFATDSFENVMFSICRFREVTGSYPQKITAVGFTFKEDRFRQLHRTALRWPSYTFDYIGRDAPASTGFNLQRASQGEHDNAVRYFQEDPYGCHSAALQEKRVQRNPFHRTPPYALSCPEMAELLHWCGPELIPLKKVPWGSRHRDGV